jgi:hypothetical protein
MTREDLTDFIYPAIIDAVDDGTYLELDGENLIINGRINLQHLVNSILRQEEKMLAAFEVAVQATSKWRARE